MGVSYNRLWKMLINKNMKRIEMQYLTGISGNILARMGKNQYVSMETIEKICKNRGYEKGDSQIFWVELLTTVFGVTEISQFISFEDT
nr:helix-turn-helix transcriptional regulator [uncultured Blautia sp.]